MPCTKDLRWHGGQIRGTHIHELRVGQTFELGGRRGKVLRKVELSDGEVVGVDVGWAYERRRFNVGTERYRTERGWTKPVAVAPCAEIDS